VKKSRGGQRRYIVNEHFFKRWSHDMAYILGLWWADGCIYNNIFNITLSENDSYLLNNILLVMNSNYPVRKKQNAYCFEINSKTIISDIISLGGSERKSLTCTMPFVPTEFLPDFIRGYWDGDGTIHLHNKKYYISGCVSCSKKFISELASILRDHIPNTKPTVRIEKNKNNQTSYRIEMGYNDTRRLRDFMYTSFSTLRMKRKYILFCRAGVITRDFRDKKFLSCKDAKLIVKKLNIKTQSDWFKFFKFKNDAFLGLPSAPYDFYKGKGWVSWSDFLGNDWISFVEARKVAKALNLKNTYEWNKYCLSFERNPLIPTHPDRTYKNRGWISWSDFLGKD
jgi:hypothetical protein